MFSHIAIDYEEIRSISPYSLRMWENTDQKNSEYGHFLRSGVYRLMRHSKGVFGILSNGYDGDFSRKKSTAITMFTIKFHNRCLTGFQIGAQITVVLAESSIKYI